MTNLKLHSSGENDYLELLKQKFDAIVSDIRNNTSLNDEEKKAEIEVATANFETEKKKIRRSFF